MTDPLDELIVKTDQKPDLKVLAEILEGYIRIVENGQINFEEKYYALKQWQMVMVYLLARKAAAVKGLLKETEGIAPKDIAQNTSLPSKNIRKFLAIELKGIVSNQKGCYVVPNYNLLKCKAKLL
jgi:hypothetical protein